MSVHCRHALNALLYQTGTQSQSFMLVLATNRPGDLDSAVLDRMDASVLVDIPGPAERARLVSLYLDEYCVRPALESRSRWRWGWSMRSGGALGGAACFVDEQCSSPELLAEVTARTAGFSGREVSKLFIAAQHAMLLEESRTLTPAVLRAVVRVKVGEHEQKAHFDTQAARAHGDAAVGSAAGKDKDRDKDEGRHGHGHGDGDRFKWPEGGDAADGLESRSAAAASIRREMGAAGHSDTPSAGANASANANAASSSSSQESTGRQGQKGKTKR